MKALEKIPGINPLLSRIDSEFVVAFKEKRICELEKADLFSDLTKIINRSYAELGMKVAGNYPAESARYLDATVQMLASDLLVYFPNVTVREINNAVRRGIRKEYGEYFGFNVIAIHGFVEKYLNSEERNKALKKQHDFELITQTKQEEKVVDTWQITFDGLKSCYEDWCKTGRLIDFGSINYQFLVAAGEINLSNEDKQFIYDLAQSQIKLEKAQEVPDNRLAYRRIMEELTDVNLVISKAKEIALIDYFATKPDLDKLIPTLKEAWVKLNSEWNKNNLQCD